MGTNQQRPRQYSGRFAVTKLNGTAAVTIPSGAVRELGGYQEFVENEVYIEVDVETGEIEGYIIDE